MIKKTINTLDSLLSWKTLMWINIIYIVGYVIDAVYNQTPCELNYVINHSCDGFIFYLLHTLTKKNKQYKQLYGPLPKK